MTSKAGQLRYKRGGPQPWDGVVAFGAVVPDDGDFLADELDVDGGRAWVERLASF